MTNRSDGSDSAAHTGSIPTDQDLCSYIADICDELRDLTQRPKLRTISYLLGMAGLEAERMSQALGSAMNAPDGKS